MIYEEAVPLERLEPSLQAANAVAMKIQYTALMSMMKSENLRRGRWMVSFGYGANSEPNVKQIEDSACVAPIDKIHILIEDSVAVDAHTLMQLASTCMNKLASMASRSSMVLLA